MGNRARVKRRKRNGQVQSVVGRSLQMQMQMSLVIDALARIVGVDLVKAEIAKIQQEMQSGGPKQSDDSPGSPDGESPGVQEPTVQETSPASQDSNV